ncbi:MAG: 1-deoxy-D-xylulose-5-phosphate reductoisomerase [Pseudomonadota bacterium]
MSASPPASPQRLTILGSTGTIGVNTLRVVAEHPGQFFIHALTAHSNSKLLAAQCRQFVPRFAVLGSALEAAQLQQQLRNEGLATEVLHGTEALVAMASSPDVDTVMAAIVGGAGLLPTLAAARTGKKVLLANKEALVMAGDIFTEAARCSGAAILPIDSEHNAIFQCLPMNEQGRFQPVAATGFERIVLTASGGPFRLLPAADFAAITPDQACAHPNWVMGRKISVDSATLVNKGLELIEASYLFDTPPNQIDVVVHPQSIVHSMVYYRDGSVLAQLGNPDMRTPIAYGLAWPARIKAGVTPLDLTRIGRLDFMEPDLQRFPGLALGRAAAESKGSAPNIFNAANEIAVAAFLARQISFQQIPAIIAETLSRLDCPGPRTLSDVLAIDASARELSSTLVDQLVAKAGELPA